MTTATETFLDRDFDDIIKSFEDLEIDDACRQLGELRREYEHHTANKKDMEQKYARVQELINERMEDRKVSSLAVDGVQYVAAQTEYGQIQDRAEYVAWAETHDTSLIEVKERKALLNELIRERIDNNEELPPGTTFYVKRYVSQRAQ